MDGVADTPEKMEKYIRTIYNKANEMDTLINELTLYSKIDTNRIPYNFKILSVNDYFSDCAEDLSLDLEAKNIEFGYFNYVEEEVQVIADAEQITRVIHNIVNNSVKYMDKEKGKINLRIKDVGDFVQVEIEDNGKGIAAKDLPNISRDFIEQMLPEIFEGWKRNRLVDCQENHRRTWRQDMGYQQREYRHNHVFCA